MVSTFWATLNPVFPPPPTSAARHPAPGALGGGTWGAAHTHTHSGPSLFRPRVMWLPGPLLPVPVTFLRRRGGEWEG